MDFKKTDLAFLSIYSQMADNKSPYNNKVEIIGKDKKAYFLFRKTDISILNYLDIDTDDDFRVVFEIGQFNSLISSCNDKDVITVKDKGIEINNKSKYDLETFDIEFDEDFFNSMIAYSIDNSKKMKLENTSEINFCRSFMGPDNLNTVAVFSNYYIASNQSNYSCVMKASDTYTDNFYYPSNFISILPLISVETESFEFGILDEHFIIQKGNLKIIIAKKDDYIVPNLREPEYIKEYVFDNSITLNTKEVLSILKRLNTVSQAKYGNRIYVSFENNKMILSNKDVVNAVEEIDITYPDILKDQKIVISVINLIKALTMIKDDSCVMKLGDNLQESFICTIANTDESKYILLNLYE